MGRSIAEQNLNTIYKFMLKVLSPNRLISLLPNLWNIYFREIQVIITTAPEGGRGTCTVKGLPVPYLSQAAVGWIEYGYERVGAKTRIVTERAWESQRIAADELIFDLTWRD
jgi:hypothetical protein